MFDIVLFQPEIPPNTGNIVRLSANAGCRLHLVHPLGFSIDDKALRRAGMDYAEFATVMEHEDWAACHAFLAGRRIFALTTRGTCNAYATQFKAGDVFLFGPESRGLPESILADLPEEHRLRLPMVPGNRSLNLSNAVAVLVFEAWRQQGFAGGG